MSTVEKKKMISLKSSEGETFEVEEKVALESGTIKDLMEDCASGMIPIPNVTGTLLSKVIEYCKQEDVEAKEGNDDDIKNWYFELLNVDNITLAELLTAANYLDLRGLYLTSQIIADRVKDMTPEEVRNSHNYSLPIPFFIMSTVEKKKKMISLKSWEGETFEVEEKVALESGNRLRVIPIPIPKVTATILAMVIESRGGQGRERS